MRKKQKAPEWLRWLYLGMAFFAPFSSWMDFRGYEKYHAMGLYSPEKWAESMEVFHFRWAVVGLMTAGFLYCFFVLTWDNKEGKDHSLPDILFCTAMLLIWACLPLLLSLHSSVQGIWCLVLVAIIVVVGRSWVIYFENKRLEEQNYE